MIYREGTRHNIPRLTVTRVSAYVATIHHEQEIVKWRYAFTQEQTGDKFVYSGRQHALLEGRTYDLRGTIKRERDRFGLIRLARIRKVELQPELPL